MCPRVECHVHACYNAYTCKVKVGYESAASRDFPRCIFCLSLSILFQTKLAWEATKIYSRVTDVTQSAVAPVVASVVLTFTQTHIHIHTPVNPMRVQS